MCQFFDEGSYCINHFVSSGIYQHSIFITYIGFKVDVIRMALSANQITPQFVLANQKTRNLLLTARLKSLLRLVYSIPRQLMEDVGFQTCSILCSHLRDMFGQLSRSTKIELRGKVKLNHKII